jgi:hypothetical protein
METYTGSCHCGAIKYEVEMELGKALECNCSHCAAKGLLLTFVPESQFTLQTPSAPLTEYKFNKMAIQHLFCPTCGVEAFGKGTDREGASIVSINIRSLDGVNLDSLERMPFDGKSV